MFYKTILNNCCNYKNINFYEFKHAHIYISHENVMTELKLLWKNLKSFDRISYYLYCSGLEEYQVQLAEFRQNL